MKKQKKHIISHIIDGSSEVRTGNQFYRFVLQVIVFGTEIILHIGKINGFDSLSSV